MALFIGRGSEASRGTRSVSTRFHPNMSLLEDRVVPALTFTNPTDYDIFRNSLSVAAGDLDLDGYDDYVVSDQRDTKNAAAVSNLYIFINNKAGGFLSPNEISLGAKAARSIELIDLDNDNKLDLVAAFDTDQIITVFQGNGDGTFGTSTQLDKLSAKVSGLAFGDFDGDNLPDIVTTAGSKVAIFYHNPDGTMKATPDQFEKTNASFINVDTGDFDSDGIPDIVLTDDSTNGVFILTKTKTSNFLFSASPLTTGSDPTDVVAADFNNDGRPDIAYGAGQNVGLFLNNGKGAFSKSPATFAMPGTPLSMEASDFNADGNRDLIVAHRNPNGDRISILEGRGNGTFLNVQTFEAFGIGVNPIDIAVADFDLDQRPDWVAISNETGGGTAGVSINTTKLVATQILIQGPNVTPSVGDAFDVTVSVTTRTGVPVPDYLGTVTFSSNDPRATLPDDYTFTATDKGTKVFSVTFLKAGTVTTPIQLTAEDPASTTLTKTVDLIVAADPAVRLSILNSAAGVTLGDPFDFTVQLLDQYDNVAIGYSGRVTFSSTDLNAEFSRNGVVFEGQRKVLQGQQDFTIDFSRAGTQQITVTDSNDTSLTGSSTVVVSPPADPGEQPGEVPEEPGFPIPSLPATSASGLDPARMQLVSVSGPNSVRVFTQDGERIVTVNPSGSSGTPRSSLADLNGDNIPEIIAAAAPGAAPQLTVYDGATGTVLRVIDAFEPSFTGGLYLAVGDVNGDGSVDAVITPDQGGGPRVRIIDLVSGIPIADFFGIEDISFRGGARTSLGDINGDGRLDLLVAAGFGGGPRIAGYDGTTINTLPVKLFSDFFVFEDTLRNGVFITSGDIDADGVSDLLFGAGPGGAPRVYGISGKPLVESGFQVQVANFFAGSTDNRGGIRVAVKDLDGDNLADLVTGSGAGGTEVQYFLGANITPTLAPPATKTFNAFDDTITSGVYVG